MINPLDFIFPPRQVELNATGILGKPVTEEEAELRARGLKYIDKIYAGASYENSPQLHKAIHAFKYRSINSLADEMVKIMNRNIPDIDGAVVVPVPLHWTRKFSRGFNQSELLMKSLNIPITNLLRRTRPTGHQMKRDKSERLTALKDAFRCTAKNPPPKVILIDDLSTTGATLDECAKSLKLAGVEQVLGWVIAQA
jgi:ComF family protein